MAPRASAAVTRPGPDPGTLTWSLVTLRRTLVVIAFAGVLSATAAYAAGSATTSSTLASGSDTVARCDNTPVFTYTFAKSASGLVTSVTVADIDAACAGGRLSLALRPAHVTGGPTMITACAATCSVTVPLASNPLPSQATSVVAVIVGP